MASRDTRARIAAAGDFYLCPLPQVQLNEGEFDAALDAVCNGEHVLSSVVRDGAKGQPEVIAEGYEYPMAMSPKGEGQVESWTERRLVVRSVRQAGYPPKPGHHVTSITYGEDLMALSGQGQRIDLR